MPLGLKILYGDAKQSTNGPANARPSWTCTGFEDRLTDLYPICPAGSKVERIHAFPNCWDGKNTDSANHRTHIVFANQQGKCPQGFKNVPQLQVTLVYNVPLDVQQKGQYKVDAFAQEKHNPRSDHDDFANVMSQQDHGPRGQLHQLRKGLRGIAALTRPVHSTPGGRTSDEPCSSECRCRGRRRRSRAGRGLRDQPVRHVRCGPAGRAAALGEHGSGDPAAGSAQLSTSTVEGLGTVLTDAAGHTLYRYAKDSANPSRTACVGACEQAWPPLLSDTPVLGVRCGRSARRPGHPARRAAAGDGRRLAAVHLRQGHRHRRRARPERQRRLGGDHADGGEGQAAAATTLGTTDIGGLGPVLTDQAGRTLYLFTKDGKGSGQSTCDGTCAKTWPPLLVDGRITVAQDIDTGLVGRITRADGREQVTVGGWPVYTYAKDGAPGEATGHGAGNTWYAMEPNGCKVDPSRRPEAATGGS